MVMGLLCGLRRVLGDVAADSVGAGVWGLEDDDGGWPVAGVEGLLPMVAGARGGAALRGPKGSGAGADSRG
jgi:hypothetical protein